MDLMLNKKDREIFENLFVLELANNHWGSVARGKKIIDAYEILIKKHQLKASIKLQFRNKEGFIHPSFFDSNLDSKIRYIEKTKKTALSYEEFSELINYIKNKNVIPMATPFDETSVQWCADFDLPIIKIASSDINDWPLLNAVSELKKPVICSTGGAQLEQIDQMVAFFEAKDIPLAINHCVSLYPTEDQDLNLNQIDFLKKRYVDYVIGFSTHEYHDWKDSMLIAYAKGARTFERHIDIDLGDYPVSPYCSLPEQVDQWFLAFHRARLLCGDLYEKYEKYENKASEKNFRNISEQEKNYIHSLFRGAYAKRDLPEGYCIDPNHWSEDIYLAIPYQPGQKSGQDILSGGILKKSVKKDAALWQIDF